MIDSDLTRRVIFLVFGDRITELREEAKLTQEELADKIGITRAALSHYEKNRREPDYETLKKIADYFNVSTDWLLGRSPLRNLFFDNSNIESIEIRKSRKAEEISMEKMEEIGKQIANIERTLAELKRSLSENDEN